VEVKSCRSGSFFACTLRGVHAWEQRAAIRTCAAALRGGRRKQQRFPTHDARWCNALANEQEARMKLQRVETAHQRIDDLAHALGNLLVEVFHYLALFTIGAAGWPAMMSAR
jgi:hypothetical protein